MPPQTIITARDTDLGACLGVEIKVYKGVVHLLEVKILFGTFVFGVQHLPHLEGGSLVRCKGAFTVRGRPLTVIVHIAQGREISIDLVARFIAMLHKRPCRTQRRLDAGLNVRLVVAAGVVILGACDDEEALYKPEPLSVANIGTIISRCRPSIHALPTDCDDESSSTCNHPVDSQIEDCGQVVCTLCGLCTGCVYERPIFALPNNGITIERTYFYRPEAYLKIHIKRLCRGVSQRFADRLHHIWPYICKMFKRLDGKDAVITKRTKTRKNILSYPYVIELILFRWGVDTTTLDIKPMKTVSRRREAIRLWALLESQ